MLTIVIDPGHGGNVKVGGSSPNNATGPAGTFEKNVTLAIAHAAKTILSKNNTVILTRDYDINLGLADRANVAFKNSADLFLSIHLNGWHSPNVQGTECYYHSSANKQSQDYAKLVQTEILKVTGLRNRGVKSQNMGVLHPSRHLNVTAACLLEVSFLTDPAEEIRLNDKLYIDRLGYALAQACQAFDPHVYDKTVSPQISGRRPTISEEFEDGTVVNSQASSVANRDFLGSTANNLRAVKGIGAAREKALLGMNISSLVDLVQLPNSGIVECAEELRVSVQTIEDWIVQAKNKV